MGGRSPQTVEPPYNQDVTTLKRFQHRRQTTTLLMASRHAVVFKYTITARQTQRVSL
ncbi:hypothetical protein D3C80_1883990 [compost metagenome]